MFALMNRKKPSASAIVDRLFYQQTGQIVISAVFGIALALLFQKACKGRKCIIIQAPPLEALSEIHKHDKKCYVYTPRYVECPATSSESAASQ